MNLVVEPYKIGLKLRPIMIMVLYRNADGHLRKLQMPLRSLTVTTDATLKAEQLQNRHRVLQSVPIVLVIKLIQMAQQTLLGFPVEKAASLVQSRLIVDGERDLNKVSSSELQCQKYIMEVSFLRNNVATGDAHFVYDRQMCFEQNAKSNWDDEQSD